MKYISIYFVLLLMTDAPSGYIPTQDVYRETMGCGKIGLIVGVLIDKPTNPTKAYWTDPDVAGRYCEIDIKDRVIGLAPGTYELATTFQGKDYAWNETPERYFLHDPHTSATFIRINGTGKPPAKITNIRKVVK